MKRTILANLFAVICCPLLLATAIHNFRKNPADNMSLFSICFFSGLIGLGAGQIISAAIRHLDGRKRGY